MAKKKIIKKIDDIAIDTEVDDVIEPDDADDVDETDETDDDEGAEPPKKTKSEFFPKKLPKSEPPKEPKQKPTEFDAISSKIDELGAKVDQILNPLKTKPEPRQSRLFDEFDITLTPESEA